MRSSSFVLSILVLGCAPADPPAGDGTTTSSSSSSSSLTSASTETSTDSGEGTSSVDSSSGVAEPACNGSPALCDRAFDRVVFPGTHNSVAATESGFAPINANQHRPVLAQLQDGIRLLLLDVTYDSGETALCHGLCTLGSRPHVEVLAELEQFMVDNPREVIAIIYQDDVDPADVAADYDEVGLTALTYEHAGGQWPTLGAMIDAGTRLVVTAENEGPPPPWYHHVWDHAWDTPYTFASVDAFDCTLNRGSADNPLFLVNHWVSTRAGLPDASAAPEANAAAVLEARMQECMTVAGRLPTFVAVDFYDEGDLLAVVAALNEQ